MLQSSISHWVFAAFFSFSAGAQVFFSDSEAKLSVYGADCTLASYGYDFVLFVLSQAEYFLKGPP